MEIFLEIAKLVFLLWFTALFVALVRHWIKWRFIGLGELVRHVWRGEVGR